MPRPRQPRPQHPLVQECRGPRRGGDHTNQKIFKKYIFIDIPQVGCDGSCLTLTRLSLAMGGDYLCSASNGVGHPAHASIHVTVLCESRQLITSN